MREKMKHLNTTKKMLTFLVSAALALVLFLGCKNLIPVPSVNDSNNTASNDSSSTGKIKVAIDLEETSSRSALPSAFPTGSSSFVFAGAIHAQGETLTAEMFKIAESSVVSGSDNKQMSVSFPFQVSSSPRENYILEIYAFPNGTTNITNLNTALLCGNSKITIGTNEISVVISDTVKMLPNTSSTVTGSVSLKISIPDDYELSAECTTTDHTSESFGCAKSSGTYSVTASALSHGDHTVTFLIKKGERVVMGWTETIKIYPSLVTDRWTSGNVDASGVRVISSVELDTTYYVRGTPKSGNASDSWFADIGASGDDTNGDGSIVKPFATVQKAVDRIKAINDGSTEYTIYVDGKVTATGGVGTVAQINMGTAKLNLTISGLGSEKAILDGGRVTNASVVSASGENLTLTLEKLKITGADIPLDSGIYGGGVHAWNGTYTFKDCEISGNQARHGGGLALYGGKPFVMDNCVVNGNKAVYGGGILVRYGTLTLKGGTVIGDKTLTSYATSEKHGNMSIGNGGGVTLSGEYGGADPTLIVESGCYIAGNYCDATNNNGDNSASGGVCMQTAAKLQLKEGAFIQYNFADAYNSKGGKGGGILITSGAKNEDIIISGNIIGNRAAVNGGGIYNDGRTVVIASTANISGNSSPKGKGIYNNGILKMADAVKIPATDDIFLVNGKTVTVTGDLTGTTPVATITPESYPSGSTDVQVLDGDATLVSESCGKFAVTAQRDGTEWEIDSSGFLKKIESSISVTEACGKIANPDSNPLNINVKITNNSELQSLSNAIYEKRDSSTKINLTIANDSTIIALPLISDGYQDVGVFSLCTNLLSIVIPSTITSIAAGTFSGCTNLASVEFKNTSGWKFGATEIQSDEISNPTANATKLKDGGAWFNYALTNENASTNEVLPASAAVDLLKSSESAGQPVDIEVSVNGAEDLAALLDALRKTDASEVSIVIDTEGITTLDPGSFSGMSTLTQVEIKGSVTTIADSAFGSCTNLESVIISGNVTTIGDNAFSNCDQLTSIEVGEGVKEIGNGAFSGCDNLSEINLPNSLETIGERAFTENAATEINIPEGVKEIKQGAFSNCSKIRKITLPSTLEKMANGAFSNCTVLAEVIFTEPMVWYTTANSNYTGGTMVFVNDPSAAAEYFKPTSSSSSLNWYRVDLTEKSVAEAQTELSGAGYGSTVTILVKITSDTELSNLASSIKSASSRNVSVNLFISESSTITAIPDNGFKNCTNLKSIVIPSVIYQIGESAFSCDFGTMSLENAVFAEPTNWRTTSSSDYTGGNSVDVSAPGTAAGSLKSLSSYYWYRPSVVVLPSPSSVAELSSELSSDTVNGKNVSLQVNLDNISLSDIKSILTSSTTKVASVDLVLTLDNNTSQTTIPTDAFNTVSKLRSLVIPEGITEINSNGIYSCTNLETLVLPNTLTTINSKAFTYCESLKKVVIPRSVTYMGKGAFEGCGVTDIEFADSTNWYYETLYTNTPSFNATNSIDVSNSATNATNLKGQSSAWSSYYFYKKPTP